ncbi:DUF3040 domain-containing protein [Herbidospora galbida]|uniref:DUF3040 domain-containing protein n=1 Tax=Herbidospora galbida TaxID=2575442 RepID=A0A4U3MSC0_9ACTN|nr:DUF3040 domain-containing protein [Herbidospora galbida]
MAQSGTDPLHALEEQMQRGDPHGAPALEAGRPRRPRAYRRRRGLALALLAVSVAMLVTGMMLPQGLLLAAGLVTAPLAMHLLTPPQNPRRPASPNRQRRSPSRRRRSKRSSVPDRARERRPIRSGRLRPTGPSALRKVVTGGTC